jgi:hypothetical protein
MNIDIRIPGRVWYDYLDPMASGMAAEIGLPRPHWTKVGKGHQAIYREVSVAQAREVAEFLMDRGFLLLNNVEPEEREIHRKAVEVAQGIYALVGR